VEQDKAERKENLLRLLTSGPSFGLFEDNVSKSDHKSANHSLTDKAMTGRRKRKRTEVELLCDGVQGSFDPSPRSPKHVRRDGPGQDEIKLSNETWERKETKEPPTGL
jgi:hypothetical protein